MSVCLWLAIVLSNLVFVRLGIMFSFKGSRICLNIGGYESPLSLEITEYICYLLFAICLHSCCILKQLI